MSFHRIYSNHLRHDFELKVYGQGGHPFVIFPASQGRFWDFENYGMIHAIWHWIGSGKIQVFCVDGIDWQSLFNHNASAHDKAKRNREYCEAIMWDVVPYIRQLQPEDKRSTPFTACGTSWGAYHSINFMLKYPGTFATAICLSGVYSLDFLCGDSSDGEVYMQDPLRYLPNISDLDYLGMLAKCKVVIVVGQGRWEEESIRDSDRLCHLLHTKGIHDVWYDKWGHDVDHDWPAWRHQLPYILGKIGY